MYLLALLLVSASIAIPVFLKIGIDTYIAQADVTGLVGIAAGLCGLIVVVYLSAKGQGVLMMRIGYQIQYRLRQDLLIHLQYLSFRFFDTQKTGQIMSRLTNDVQVLEELLRAGLNTIFIDIIMLIGITIAMFSIDPRLSLVIFITVPLFMVLVFILRTRLINTARRIQRHYAAVNAFLNESISGIKVIRSFARENENIADFRSINKEYYTQTRSFYRLTAYFWQGVATVSVLGQALVLLGGGILLAAGSLTLGTIAAFLLYINRFFQPLQNISNMLNQLSRAMASAERIFAVMDVPRDVEDRDDAITEIDLQGDIEFRDVWFAYEGEEFVARKINFQVEAGKTTLINLLCRFYDPIEGAVIVDGHDLRDLTQAAYRSHLAVVMQDARIFSGTVIENIRYGKPDATFEEVVAIAEEMGIHQMIQSMPRGYDTRIGEQGANLSLGQKQLLAFARALIRDPRILILDEASAYLDSQSEKMLQTAMQTLRHNRTSFIISHRLSTIQGADTILVLENGQIVESGSHAELMQKGQHFARLVESQYTPSN